jgi:ribosomal peptide maturation radical SAM protein 1
VSAAILITMPWDILASPSLALGTLQQLLLQEHVDVKTRSLKLKWIDYLLKHQRRMRDPITFGDYEQIARSGYGIGDWVFARPPIAPRGCVRDYRKFLHRGGDDWRLPKLMEMRRLVPGFLAECVAEIAAERPKVVGFTTTFCQNMASLALARQLKLANPALRIVFGGANCEGPMGAALQRAFLFIDVVVRGEAENVVGPLFRDLIAGEPVRAAPGLCFFEGDRQVVTPPSSTTPVAMERVPVPHYDDYFRELSGYGFGQTLRGAVFLSFETSRGCWWGEVAHCTFCGLNGANMAFRRKTPERAFADAMHLARTYHVLDLHAVDNIIDHSYYDSFLPKLAASGCDLRLFYEVKSNVKKTQVQQLRRAGVRRVQPGIESLSTPILRLMRKGVTAYQNLRLLKWCRRYEITPDWNLLYGFPGEEPAEYQRMAQLFPSLWHLAPPITARLALHRWSPYFEHAAEHGIEITGPSKHYKLLYDVDADTLFDIAHEFAYRHTNGARPEIYVRECLDAVERWCSAYAAGASLTYRRGPGYLRICDRRTSQQLTDFTLEDREAQIYAACDDGATLHTIAQRTGLQADGVQRCLDDLAAERLVYCEGERYLGLALPSAPIESEMFDERTVVEEPTIVEKSLPRPDLVPIAAVRLRRSQA